MKIKRRLLLSLPLAACILILAASASAQDTVKNKTYDVWVSQSFATPPYAPFQDCLYFPPGQVCLAQCGDCGTVAEAKIGAFGLSFWTGTVPCGGLNLQLVGTSVDGNLLAGQSGADVAAASIVGTAQGTTFGLQGVADPLCLVAGSGAKSPARNPYDKGSAVKTGGILVPQGLLSISPETFSWPLAAGLSAQTIASIPLGLTTLPEGTDPAAEPTGPLSLVAESETLPDK